METTAGLAITTLCGVIRDIYWEAENRKASEGRLRAFCLLLRNIEEILEKASARTKEKMHHGLLYQIEELSRSVLDMLQKTAREPGFKMRIINVITGASNKVNVFIAETQQSLQVLMTSLILDFGVSKSDESRLVQSVTVERMHEERSVMEGWKIDASCLSISHRKLGSGEFACTFEGLLNNKPVAVKIRHERVLREIAQDPAKLIKFNHEVQNLFKVHHPNIVSVFGGIGLEGPPGMQLVIVMEQLDRTLLDEIQQSDSPSNRSRAERLRISHETCRGLAYLHSQREPILHRDLNLKNVMLDANRVVKIINFGSSRTTASGSAKATVVAAAPGWVAPEVAQGFAQNGYAQPTTLSDTFMVSLLCAAVCTCDVMAQDHPEQNRQAIVENLRRARIPPEAITAIAAGLSVRSADRPAASEITLALARANEQLSKGRNPKGKSPVLEFPSNGRNSPSPESPHAGALGNAGAAADPGGLWRLARGTPGPEMLQGSPKNRSPDSPSQRLPEGWVALVDQQGRACFFNEKSNCMQWHFPGTGVVPGNLPEPQRRGEPRSPLASASGGAAQGTPGRGLLRGGSSGCLLPGGGAALGSSGGGIQRGGSSGGLLPPGQVQVRGLCAACGEHVTTNQKRERLPSGQLRHKNGRCDTVPPSA